MGQFIREYLQRVVIQRDVTAVEDVVRLDYRGSGPVWSLQELHKELETQA